MDKESAITLIKTTFTHNFSKEHFRNFIINLLDHIDENKSFIIGNAHIPLSFREYINSYERIGKYIDSNNNEIEVLSVHLKKTTALDRARTMQRNFIAWYLNGGRGGVQRDCALVAFYNEDLPDWRFSYVKMDYNLVVKDTGKVAALKEFTPAKRFSFLVGEQEPNHTAQKRLLSILEKDKPSLNDIEEVFNIEKVSKEFFAKYKELFLKLVDNLIEIRKSDHFINTEFTLKQVSEANFCKKLLGQIVFLYFLQKKGWLGVEKRSPWGAGDKKFLRNLFNKTTEEGKNFFNDYLEYLFYEALNSGERDDDFYGKFDCKIPFLNGGLFEPINDYNWATTDIILPNELFSNDKKTPEGDIGTGILDIFDRYNFTVKEDEPLEKEVAVDPEMLGKVFEELLEVQDRKSKGAFYTPREIVHYMCQESLINHLSTELEGKIDKEDIDNFIRYGDVAIQNEATARAKEKKIKAGEQKTTTISYKLAPSIKDYAKEIDKSLATIKICDPAIGSGAFPVGMMNEIIRARLTLLESDYLRTFKEISEKEAYISKMRYEYKREAIQNSIYGVDIDSGAIEIAKLRLWMSLIVDEDDVTKIKPLPNLDYKIVCGNSLIDIEKNLFNAMHLKKLEELKPEYFSETRKREKKKLKKEIDNILEELTKGSGFDFEIHFSEVFHEKGGFDVVIGNPPYIRQEAIKEFKPLFKKSFKVFNGTADIYTYFYEQGWNILKQGGFLTYITSNKWLRTKYGENLRKFFKESSTIKILIDFGGHKVFDNATVDSNIILFQKGYKKANVIYAANINTAYQKETALENYIQSFKIDLYQDNLDSNCFTIGDTGIISLKNKIESIGKPLKDWDVHINYGIKTGFNEAFIINTETKDKLCKDNPNSCEIIKPLLRGRDIYKYGYKWVNLWLVNTHNGFLNIPAINTEKEYPTIFSYLNQYQESLKKRYDKGNHWSNLRNCAYLEEFQKEKIIWQEMVQEPSFAYNHSLCYGNDTTTFMTGKHLKFLLSVLNSKAFEFFFRQFYAGGGLGGKGYRLKKEFIHNFPIPKPKNEKPFVDSVEKILDLTSSEDYLENQTKQHQVKQYENQIDLMVYKLYELDYSEVLIVDPEFLLSQEEYEVYQLPEYVPVSANSISTCHE